MISVNCDNPILFREDRVYRYVGNGSDRLSPPNDTIEQLIEPNQTNLAISEGVSLKDILHSKSFLLNLSIDFKSIFGQKITFLLKFK